MRRVAITKCLWSQYISVSKNKKHNHTYTKNISMYFMWQSSYIIWTYLFTEGAISTSSRYWTDNLLELTAFVPNLTQYYVINQKHQITTLTYQILEYYQNEIFNMTYCNLHDKLLLRIFDMRNWWINSYYRIYIVPGHAYIYMLSPSIVTVC